VKTLNQEEVPIKRKRSLYDKQPTQLLPTEPMPLR